MAKDGDIRTYEITTEIMVRWDAEYDRWVVYNIENPNVVEGELISDQEIDVYFNPRPTG